MHQGKFHLIALLFIPTIAVVFAFVEQWWIKLLTLAIAATVLYVLFRPRKNGK
jgi:membrane protein implicated in regulation of membrane protease activity